MWASAKSMWNWWKVLKIETPTLLWASASGHSTMEETMSDIGKEIKRVKVNPVPIPQETPAPAPLPTKEPEKCPVT